MSIITVTKKVDGMICPSCEDELCSYMLHVRGIISADASYRKSEITVEYDSNLINVAEIESSLSAAGYPVGEGKSGMISDIISIAAVILLYFLLPTLSSSVDTSGIGKSGSIISIFLIGAATGVHCICMCGGIMLSVKNAVAYNVSRVLSYTVVGAVFGAIGSVFSYTVKFKSILFTMSGAAVILVGLMMWGIPFLRSLSPALTPPCRFKGGSIIVGIATGLMPCGALSSMWILSASSGSALYGSLYMFLFGLGTCVFMVLFGIFGIFIPKKYNRYMNRVSTVLIVSLGLILMVKGLRLI